jgi:hypothetical protein
MRGNLREGVNLTELHNEIAGLSKLGGYVCTVEDWLSQREDRADWEEVLADNNLRGSAIWRAMHARGYQYKVQAVTRHRRMDCSCRQPL